MNETVIFKDNRCADIEFNSIDSDGEINIQIEHENLPYGYDFWLPIHKIKELSEFLIEQIERFEKLEE